MPRRMLLPAFGIVVTVISAWAAMDRGFDGSPEHPAIGYFTQPSRDPVAQLIRDIQRGATRFKGASDKEYIRSILDALNIPVESQVAVFSKTSFQSRLIDPTHPRTLFFNDSVMVGWVRGGFVEFAAQDPRQGVQFYTLRPGYLLGLLKDSEPQPGRDCLSCHISQASYGVPGMLVRSVFPAPDGMPLRQLGEYVPDDRSPMQERWGGWYVTGNAGAMGHMGNATVADKSQKLNLTSLDGQFDTSAYLSPYSDIVALMVFDHQVHMMNLLTRVGWEFRYAQYQQKEGSASKAEIAVHLKDAVKELVDHMLFVGEVRLSNRLQGTSGFAEKFAGRDPKDHLGRSLRQFDLNRRLMRYPLSYMIYADAFDGMPTDAKTQVYQRLSQILRGADRSPKYAHLSPADRKAILEILAETKKGLPEYLARAQDLPSPK